MIIREIKGYRFHINQTKEIAKPGNDALLGFIVMQYTSDGKRIKDMKEFYKKIPSVPLGLPAPINPEIELVLTGHFLHDGEKFLKGPPELEDINKEEITAIADEMVAEWVEKNTGE